MNDNLNLIVEYDDNAKNSSKHHIRNMLDYLVIKFNYKVVSFNEIVENENNLQNYFYNKYGDFNKIFIIVFENVLQFLNFNKNFYSSVNLCFIIDDIHHGKSINNPRSIVFSKCKYLFSTYAYHYERYFKRHMGVCLVPHSLAYRVDFNQNPIKKILVSGHLNNSIYPNREKMVILGKTNKYIENFKPNYNGYRISDKDSDKTYGEKYYKLLNSYLCAVSDDSIIDRRYMIAKFFEIMGCGCLLLAFNSNTKTIFEELGLIDNIHYISINENNYESMVNFVSDDENLNTINKIRKEGYDFVNNYHHYTNRAIYINKIISGNSKNEYSVDVITGTQYLKYEIE